MSSLNANSATTYNRGRRYSADVVRIIEQQVGARPDGRFTDDDARRIFDWQGSSRRFASLVPDGKFGPASNGVLIAELGRSQPDLARQLTSFPYVLPPGAVLPTGADSRPVLQFRATTITSMALRGMGSGWKMSAEFVVRLFLNPSVDASRYEYRQFIRGTCTLQPGRFTGTTPSRASWVHTARPADARSQFSNPGGLPARQSEDGQRVRGRTFRYGHRSANPVQERGLEDRYLPDQAGGHEYRARDVPGISGTTRPRGLRIRIDLNFQGRVIDVRDSNRVIRTLAWRYQGDDIIV